MPEVIQVSPAYIHIEKVTHCHGVIPSTNNRLKWYEIARSDLPIEPSIRNLAHDFVARQTTSAAIPSAQELGFVLLHRCGEGFYFLGLCTWRENNELWKTQFYVDAGKTEGFELFPQNSAHEDTFCVWELAVVAQETQAWKTYLLSDRTKHNADAYLSSNVS